ncbi:hypothetical protein G7Y89_g10226 [Cudoniella acicularis]|uniref:PD-(D/E)XK nuclease-like domain-containing protein n=1 Tax=Cudoniella acicularis TaxID=354080 RepID=A0A8H4RFH8_9HELO|nr:hypothetical protein G7Y89_g10226 [Cudoniella acicularis]
MWSNLARMICIRPAPLQPILEVMENYSALAELEVYIGVFGSRLPDNTDESFTCNGVDGVFVCLQYFFEEVVVEALVVRIEGWVDVEPLIDFHCVYLVEWQVGLSKAVNLSKRGVWPHRLTGRGSAFTSNSEASCRSLSNGVFINSSKYFDWNDPEQGKDSTNTNEKKLRLLCRQQMAQTDDSMASVNTLHNDERNSFEDYKVKVWLDNQPTRTSTAIEPATEPEVSPLTRKSSPTHKRKRDDSDHTQAADRRRSPLRETTMNSPPAKHAESDPPKRIKRGSKLPIQEQGPRRISPRKNEPTSSQLVDGEPAEAGYSRALQREEITLLPRRGTKSNSSTQSRSSSPVKTIYDLAMAEPPITFFEANSKKTQPPAAVSQLYKKVLDVSDGFNLLPESLRDSIIAYCEEFETRIPRDEYFKKSSDPPRKPTQEELHTWEAVKRIRENATRCSEDGDSEAGWGEMMVDYSMILLPDDKMHQAILQVLRDLPEEDQNVNQTRSAPVKYRPITVNIEVKLPGQGKNDAMVQLAVWAAAQLEKLNALSGALAPIGIPLVSVEGHDWRLYNTYQKEDSEVVRRVWGNDLFGDSSSTLGIYKVIAAIQILAEWSHTEYRAWFEKDVLKLLAEI